MARHSNTAPNKMSPNSGTGVLFLFLSPFCVSRLSLFMLSRCFFFSLLSFFILCRVSFLLSRLCSFCPECIFYFVPTAVCLFCPFPFFWHGALRFPAQRKITAWGFRGVRVGEASHPGAPRRHMSRPIEGRDVTPRLHLDRVTQVDDDSDVPRPQVQGRVTRRVSIDSDALVVARRSRFAALTESDREWVANVLLVLPTTATCDRLPCSPHQRHIERGPLMMSQLPRHGATLIDESHS